MKLDACGVLGVLVVLAAAACGSVDPGELTSGRQHPGGTLDTSSQADPNAPAVDPNAGGSTSGGASSSSGGSSGSSGTTDGGAPPPPPPPPTDAFTGAAAFAAKLGPSARQGSHTGVGGPANLDCAGCHNWLVGGTIWKDAAGTMPAPSVEVRVLDAAGHSASAYTDQDGNFYLQKGTGGVTLPAHVGVRDAATTKTMSATIASGTCANSGCHVSGKQGAIHLL